MTSKTLLVLFLLLVYPKNAQENLSTVEKKELKQIAESIKESLSNE
jgi:hypothetical protein